MINLNHSSTPSPQTTDPMTDHDPKQPQRWTIKDSFVEGKKAAQALSQRPIKELQKHVEWFIFGLNHAAKECDEGLEPKPKRKRARASEPQLPVTITNHDDS